VEDCTHWNSVVCFSNVATQVDAAVKGDHAHVNGRAAVASIISARTAIMLRSSSEATGHGGMRRCLPAAMGADEGCDSHPRSSPSMRSGRRAGQSILRPRTSTKTRHSAPALAQPRGPVPAVPHDPPRAQASPPTLVECLSKALRLTPSSSSARGRTSASCQR
jgi:hypothetical protein